ncbi:pyridoxamine 5'-phosphate oxidase [Lusitaniella coriacea]|uniref:pyridoxamine 5'-phosphate oxidase n=1 Tax=Lusitaniella coriacea TaxID=1983105 RepID=UPI003CEEBC7D
MSISIADLRQNYTKAGLSKAETRADPIEQFEIWFEAALNAQVNEPNAMAIATATTEGKPSVRMVLLKDFNEKGFVFYTNYESHKAQQLIENPWASLVFWWNELERQVRIEGKVERVSDRESDDYFRSRPRASQLGAWVSHQSQVIENRAVLEERLQHLEEEYRDRAIPRPPFWGGFRVVPSQVEFWQGRPSRLHDRLCYHRTQKGEWRQERLSP